jgi:hypothetical protein
LKKTNTTFTDFVLRSLGRRFNSTYKKLAVQWLNEALCFVSSLVVADSFRLRNRQLLVAAKRWQVVCDSKVKAKKKNSLKFAEFVLT